MMKGRPLVALLALATLLGCGSNGSPGKIKYPIGGSVSGLTGTGLVLQNDGKDDLPVAPGASSFRFATLAESGSTYDVSVRSQPDGQTCSVSNGRGTVGDSEVTSVTVSCESALPAVEATTVQRWTAPSTWGALWPDSPTMVQHAWFSETQIVESKGITWAVQGGVQPPLKEFKGFPAGSRFGAGPFSGQRYQASGENAVAALDGDIIVCVVVKPDYDASPNDDKAIIARGSPHGTNISDPAPAGEGWSLTQSGQFFTFHYTYTAVSTPRPVHTAIKVPTYFASEVTGTDGNPDSVQPKVDSGPLAPSYLVACAGRDAHALRIHLAVNSVSLSGLQPHAGVGLSGSNPPRLDAGASALTIGGFAAGGSPFRGRIYETAIWNEVGSQENIQKKLAAIHGLPQDGSRYVRNREAPFYGVDAVAGNSEAGYHATWRDGPRIDPARGQLFGMQGWNRLGDYARINYTGGLSPTFVFTLGENFAIAPIGGVVLEGAVVPGAATTVSTPGWSSSRPGIVATVGDVIPPGDSEQPTARKITLQPGDSLSARLREFDAYGPIHGQIWLRVAATPPVGTMLRIAASSPTSFPKYIDIDLSSAPPGQWKRYWLESGSIGSGTGLWTAGRPGETLTISNPSAMTVELYMWGLQLTQVGTLAAAVPIDNTHPADPNDPSYGGSPVGDLGAEMYDWNVRKDVSADSRVVITDALQLPPVQSSTASTGFCLSAELTPGSGLPWTAPFTSPRTALAWVDDPASASPARAVKIYLSGASSVPTVTPPQLCMSVSGVAQPLCAAVPSAWAAGSRHAITGCMSASGQMRLYGDHASTPLSSQAGSGTPDLLGGTLLVGGGSVVGASAPWHGYVSRAAICLDDVAANAICR